MGWTWYNATHYKNGKPDRKAEMDEKFTWGEPGYKSVSVLKSTMRGSVYYAAVRVFLEKTGEETVFAAVCLTGIDTKHYCNFGYKDMDETMGPGPSDCPKNILDLLTPTDSESANEWRERCRKKLERNKTKTPLPVGTVIEFLWKGEITRAVRRAPNFQFKWPWWYLPSSGKYIPAKYLPEEYQVVQTA